MTPSQKETIFKAGDVEGVLGWGKNFGVLRNKEHDSCQYIFKKKFCHPATYDSGQSKTLVDCSLRRD